MLCTQNISGWMTPQKKEKRMGVMIILRAISLLHHVLSNVLGFKFFIFFFHAVPLASCAFPFFVVRALLWL